MSPRERRSETEEGECKIAGDSIVAPGLANVNLVFLEKKECVYLQDPMNACGETRPEVFETLKRMSNCKYSDERLMRKTSKSESWY